MAFLRWVNRVRKADDGMAGMMRAHTQVRPYEGRRWLTGRTVGGWWK
ncbi:MAG: hypothetical protein R3E39_28145 [Anaerolineae bacterium]